MAVAVADLPRTDAHQIRHLVEQRLRAEAGLGDTEAPEGPGRGVVGIVGVALDLEILIGVGPAAWVQARSSTGPPREAKAPVSDTTLALTPE